MRSQKLAKSHLPPQLNEVIMTIEPFIYLFLFLLVLLVSMFAQWLKREINETASLDTERSLGAVPPEEPQLPTPKAVSPTMVDSFPDAIPTRSPMTRSTSWHRKPLLLRNREEVRRGIILMTILGPCRGMDKSLVSDDHQLFRASS